VDLNDRPDPLEATLTLAVFNASGVTARLGGASSVR
jgi:hypothetical protein